MLKKEVTLIKSVPGGSRAHIITISRTGKLTYNVGSVSHLERFDWEFVKIDKQYSTVNVQITLAESDKINRLVENEKTLSYNDKTIVKDNLQYYIYLNARKIAFGYERNFDKYPPNLKLLIDSVIKQIDMLYKISGMS